MTIDRVDVLDYGFVRLCDHMGSDLSIVRAARVSYDAAWRAGEDEKGDERLIRYLWAHHHTSPFEAVTFTFEVKAPIFVFRQWHRHRTQSYNELSARYRELSEEFYIPEVPAIGTQSTNNKQGRSTDDPTILTQRAKEVGDYKYQCKQAFYLYKRLLNQGWPRELARAVLPVSTYSHMFSTMNLLNLFRFLSLRIDSHAQYEIRVYAIAMLQLIRPVVPTAVDAWVRNAGLDIPV
jgi:thymidylate synthase (FAD)